MPKWKLSLKAALLASLLLAFAGCARTRPLPPQIQLTALQLSELSLSHAAMEARLKLFNPNDFSVKVKEVSFDLALNDVHVAHGQGARDLDIGAGQYGETSLRLSSSYFDLLQLGNRLQNSQEVNFLLEGSVRLGGFGILPVTVPIRREGSIPLGGTFGGPTLPEETQP